MEYAQGMTIVGGLVPVFLTDGLGADVMRRIALPMVGGMVSTTVLTLIVIPVLYDLWQRHVLGLGRPGRPARPAAAGPQTITSSIHP